MEATRVSRLTRDKQSTARPFDRENREEVLSRANCGWTLRTQCSVTWARRKGMDTCSLLTCSAQSSQTVKTESRLAGANRWGRSGGVSVQGGRSRFRKMQRLGALAETAFPPPPRLGGGGPAEETEGKAYAPFPHGSMQGQGQAQGHGRLGRAGWATVCPPNGNKEKSVPDSSLLICRHSM